MTEDAEAAKTSLLSPYDQGLFVTNESWIALSEILESRGAGSYGLSGPRGSGKSWLMQRAIDFARERKGVGVTFPSPSEYEPLAFLAALSDHVAADYEEFYEEETHRSTAASRSRYRRLANAGILLAYFSFVLFILGNTGAFNPESPFGEFLTFRNAVFGFGFAAGIGLVGRALAQRRRDREGLGRIQAKAEELRSKVRFTLTSIDRDEFDVGGKQGGLGAMLKRAREHQLVERPATLSSLIHDFRAFVRVMAKEVKAPVVIAIDELDKMSDSTRVAQLLRDIKGIFEIDGACFLVSISDEAAQALQLGAVRTRNEFNSSFYTVIAMPPLAPAACLELLRARNEEFDADTGRGIGILTGGIGRELVRVAERVRLATDDAPTHDRAVRVMMVDELEAFAESVLRSARGGPLAGLTDEERLTVFDAIERAKTLIEEGVAVSELVDESWDLNSSSIVWREKFAEQWRRLLVRLEIGARMLVDPVAISDDARAEALQRTVRIASASAAVGRHRLGLDPDLVPLTAS